MAGTEVQVLIDALNKVGGTGVKYTLTGAVDWPMFVLLVGGLGTLILLLLGVIWNDLGKKISGTDSKCQHCGDDLWAAINELRNKVGK